MAEEIIQKQSTTEVLTPPSEGASNLSSLFDKMEATKADGGTAREAIAEFREEKAHKSAPKPAEAAKPTEEPKKEPTALDKKLDVKEEKKTEEAGKEASEDPREALRKSFEKRQGDKDGNKPVEDKDGKGEGKHEDDVPEDELKPLPTDKPKTVKRIQALLKKIDIVSSERATTLAERDAKAKELEDLRKQVSDVKTVNPETEAKLKQYQDELAMYRRRYDLEKDPEIKTKFDGRIEASEEAIISTLKRRNATEPLLNLIKDTGGWEAFSNSSRLVAVPDGEGGQEQVSTAELADRILKSLPLGERKALEGAMLDQMSTRRERDRFFKEEQSKASEFFKKREEEVVKHTEEQAKQMESAKKTADEFVKKIESSDWLKDKEIPATASEQDKSAIKEYNRTNSQLRSLLKKHLNTNTTEGLLGIVEESLMYYHERREKAALQEEVSRLRAENKAKDDRFAKFQKAGGSVPKQGSIAVSAQKSEDDDDNRPARSLDEQFDRIASRKAGRETLLSNQ